MTGYLARFGAVVLLSLGAPAAQSSPGEAAGSVPVPAPEAEQRGLVRSLTLQELGFGQGIIFRQLAGSRTVYFPVPETAPAVSARLVLDLDAGATTDAERYLQVSVGGRIAVSRAIEGRADSFSLDIPVDPGLAEGGFLPIRFDYSGAHSDRVCVDERISGDYLAIAPGSQLRLTLDAGGVAEPGLFAGLRPPRTRIGVPDDSGPAGLAAMVRAAALFGAERGLAAFGPPAEPQEAAEWAEGRVRIDVTPAGPVSALSVALDQGRPELTVSGTDPQVGLYQLATAWSGLARDGGSATSSLGRRPADSGRVPLAELGADLNSRLVTAQEDFLVSFQSSDIPAGREVSAVDLAAAAALDPDGRGGTVSAFLNDVFLGSRPLKSGDPERLDFAVPANLVGRDNSLRVTIQRQPSAGACRFSPQGYPAQILPGSALVLSDADDSVTDFFELRQAFGGGVQLVVDSGLDLPLAELAPWLAGVAGSMVPARASVIPRADTAALDAQMPFIVVSEADPGDAPGLIRLDQGRIEIRDSAGGLMYDGSGLSRLGIVQIVERNGTPGLWLRPGGGPAPVWSAANPLTLDRGNFALIDDSGLVVSASTAGPPLIGVVYPDTTNIAEILEKYRPWLVGGLWVILTLIVLAVFQRIYRSRREPPGGGA